MVINSVEEEKKNPFASNPNIKPVPVIASFTKEGDVCPLYFAAEGIRIRVDNVKWKQNKTLSCMQFRCEITLSDRVDEVDLFYHMNERIWTLGKKS